MAPPHALTWMSSKSKITLKLQLLTVWPFGVLLFRRYVVLVLRRPGDEGGWYVEGSANVQVRAPLPDMGPPSPRLDELSLEDEDTSPVDTVTRVAPAGQVLPLGEARAVVPQALVT
jgi:hypothetical protein